MFQRMMAVMVLLAASLNAMTAQSAPAARGVEEAGVYVQIAGAGFASPAIPIANLVQMPRETRTITLMYRPTPEEQSQVERVVWDGAAPQEPIRLRGAHGETIEIYAAVVEVGGVGSYPVGLHVGFTGQIGEVARTFQLQVVDVAASAVRTVIEYPGALRTPPVDVNGDFRVDEQDLAKFWEGYGTARGGAGYASLGDWDGNGAVELEDLVRFFDAYEGWKGREVGPNYGGGTVYPLTVRPNPHGFSVPTPIYRARTEPIGFEAWIEWRVDEAVQGMGPVFTRKFDAPGRHEVSSSVFGASTEMQDARTLEIYRTTVSAFASGTPLADGVTYTFEAHTEPPGYEDYVTWFAATLYGTVTPAHGRGRTFSVRFDGTWGPLHPSRSFQWLGVQADNTYLNQDVKGTVTYGIRNVGGVPWAYLAQSDGQDLIAVPFNAGTELEVEDSIRVVGLNESAMLSIEGLDNTPYVLKLRGTEAHQAAFLWTSGFPKFSGTSGQRAILERLSEHMTFLVHNVAIVDTAGGGWVANGCTGVPNFDFKSCCDAHDACYCAGGNEAARKACDQALRACIIGKGHPILARIYYAGVRAFGKSHFIYR